MKKKVLWNRTATALLINRKELLDTAFGRNDFDLLASYGAVLTEEGVWEYWLQRRDLPADSIVVPRLLLWSSALPGVKKRPL